MSTIPSTDPAVHPLGKRGAFEGVARRHRRRRNPARMTPRSSLRTPTNRPRNHAQRWVRKVGRSITHSETPQPRTATPPARAPMTCASCAPNNSSPNPNAPGATTYPPTLRARSLPYSPSATTSSPPSSPESGHHDEAAHPNTGPTSTAITRPSASPCRPRSVTWASLPRRLPAHRQHFVDRRSASV